MVKAIHEEHGVVFHFGRTASAIEEGAVILANGERLTADLVVAGIGVKPNVALASVPGSPPTTALSSTNTCKRMSPEVMPSETSPVGPTGTAAVRSRVEHWVVAERQGQTAAINILGGRQRFDAVPFFWSQHYDVTISYVGHAEKPNGPRSMATPRSTTAR